jgi:excisionase family DNA binding protein
MLSGVAMEAEQGTASERWITIKRACEIVGVSRRIIYNSIDKGLVTTRRTAGGSTRILESSVFRADADG